MDTFSLTATVRNYPTLPFKRMKDDILGARYRLSLVFIGEKRARALNVSTRGKDYVPNVLSFPLGDTTGEVYIPPGRAATEAKKWGLSPRGYIGFLFIHALLHLKGHVHGATMEKAEKRYILKYKLNEL